MFYSSFPHCGGESNTVWKNKTYSVPWKIFRQINCHDVWKKFLIVFTKYFWNGIFPWYLQNGKDDDDDDDYDDIIANAGAKIAQIIRVATKGKGKIVNKQLIV